MSVLSRRRAAKARRLPSGDHTGPKYSPWSGVSRFSPEPSPATTKTPGAPKRRLAKATTPGPGAAGAGPPGLVPGPVAPPPPVPPPAGAVLDAEPPSGFTAVESGPVVSGPVADAVEDVAPAPDPSPSPPPRASATSTPAP